MNVKVREYCEDDFLRVEEILCEAFGIEKVNALSGKDHIGLVACVDDVVAGYLLLTKVNNPIAAKSYFLIDYVCVKSEYQNKKIGYSLINEAEKIARLNNASYLQLTSSRFRIAAHKLYKNCGFVVRDSDIFRKVL